VAVAVAVTVVAGISAGERTSGEDEGGDRPQDERDPL
jgi:hypothetical protein